MIGFSFGNAALEVVAGADIPDSDLRNRLKDVPMTWPFRNRLVPERDEVRRG
jgi:hypothetical protein